MRQLIVDGLDIFLGELGAALRIKVPIFKARGTFFKLADEEKFHLEALSHLAEKKTTKV